MNSKQDNDGQNAAGAGKAKETVLVLDFGSQYSMLIARRVREAGVYSQVSPHNITADEVLRIAPRGVILSGGPGNIYDEKAPRCDPRLFRLGIPVLGICYGLQMMCDAFGGSVNPARDREFGRRSLRLCRDAELFAGMEGDIPVWMSHGDQIDTLPDGFETIAGTDTCPHAAIRHDQHPLWGLQFHPEVTHTASGRDILRNFLLRVCGCAGTWTIGNFIADAVGTIRDTVGDEDRVVLGLSGGVDSSVAAVLIHQAIGDQLTCIYVNSGLMRADETEEVRDRFEQNFHINLRVVDASDVFLNQLKGVEEPEEKRRIIGHTFIDVFKDAARDIPNARYLAQGTLYPDVIESAGVSTGPATVIKTHHNVGGLPAQLGFDLIEPFRFLFKDEVRRVGERLGLPRDIVWRHPFPGPGLAVRILGEVTPPRLRILREADRIVVDTLKETGHYYELGQAFAVLLPLRSVGVMGDQRTYEHIIAVRAIETEDYMTADWARLPQQVLSDISNRIINQVRGVNRVVYDISSKPPATIEWE